MSSRKYVLLTVVVSCLFYGICFSKNSRRNIPQTRFTCQGRGSGYYADVETGCQVYHMCDGLGRQFTYTCPNTTLFQQRMLICDHWYMVDCSRSESDYSANLLIERIELNAINGCQTVSVSGRPTLTYECDLATDELTANPLLHLLKDHCQLGQRDKPFVSDDEMRLRTPRPDILSVPPNNNYYDGLKEAESKFPAHPDNNIVGIGDAISHDNHGGLDSAKQHYRPPTSWSTGTHAHHSNNNLNGQQTDGGENHESDRITSNSDRPDDNIAGAASQDTRPTFQPTPSNNVNHTHRIPPPDQELNPPHPPTTTESSEYDLDIRMKDSREDPVYQFIKRFDPNSPDSHKTAMSASEILNINSQLPSSQDVSTEDDRTPRNHKHATLNNRGKDEYPESSFNSVNQKPTSPALDDNSPNTFDDVGNGIHTPERILVPPKLDTTEHPSTTMGPPIYYEWKWAVPAFDLEPPKRSNNTYNTTQQQENKKSPFRDATRPTPRTVKVTQPNTEYNTSSYFVPDYIFPLDKAHIGYDNEDAHTSFQVGVSRPGRASYGENPACPHCHPAYLNPGTCEPCIVKR